MNQGDNFVRGQIEFAQASIMESVNVEDVGIHFFALKNVADFKIFLLTIKFDLLDIV